MNRSSTDRVSMAVRIPTRWLTLFCLSWLLCPEAAQASGLGQWRPDPLAPAVECDEPPVARVVGAGARVGPTFFVTPTSSPQDRRGAFLAAQVDVSVRVHAFTTGCLHRPGLFASTRYTEHELSIGADAELSARDLTESVLGARLRWAIGGRMKGSLMSLHPMFEPRVQFGAGPALVAGRPGLGAFISLRFFLDLRLSYNAAFGGADALGVQLGVSWP